MKRPPSPRRESTSEAVSLSLDRIPGLIQELYRVVRDLESLFPGRPFTPDGHLVGSLGEVLAAHEFDLELAPPSTRGFDAWTRDRRTVEIKATQRSSFALRGEEAGADLLIAMRIVSDGSALIVYAGPAAPVWEIAGPVASNGQRRVPLRALEGLTGGEQDGGWTL